VAPERLRPPELAARGPRQRPRREDLDRVGRDPGVLEDRAARALREERVALPAATALGEHEEPFAAAIARDAQRDRAAGTEPGDPRERRLELLRRVVRAAHHDDVLRASGDVELARVDEAEVARVEPAVPKRARRRGRVAEVLAEERRAPHVEPPDAALGQRTAVFVPHRDGDARHRRADGDHLAPEAFFLSPHVSGVRRPG
jgi:hypothetical protein